MSDFPTVIESIGRFLPPRVVTTREVLDGCAHQVRVPLERLTGIRSRHFAGDDEFALDLAKRAIEDCLLHSRRDAKQFDLLISANISRYDAPGTIGYEPSSAIVLKRLLGFDNAIAFDISNACATMWTAAFVADAFIQSGAIKNAMVVSGEFISHLTRTAQREIESYLDPQLASLTLGDAGVAVALSAGERNDHGFQQFDMYTLGRYSRLCVAKPSDRPHGGAVMHTDAVKVTAAIVPHAAAHAVHVLQQAGNHVDDMQHIIPHQTSRLTIQGALDEIARRFDSDCREKMIDNLECRGNTASTTHFLALRDCIDSGRIHSGDKILFAISGSGQTTGTAIYHCDDLPDRIRAAHRNGKSHSGVNVVASPNVPTGFDSAAIAMPFRFRAIATSDLDAAEGSPDTMAMLKDASLSCLKESGVDRSEIEMVISTGVYRTEFLTEPALAALLAGDLGINEDQPAEHPVKTFAFDLLNGSLGFLNACFLVNEMGRAGKLQRALVVASEIENNPREDIDGRLGLKEMASAVILEESEDGETGFQAFQFGSDCELQDRYQVICKWRETTGEAHLIPQIDPHWQSLCLPMIERSVDALLASQGLDRASIHWWLPPQGSLDLATRIGQSLGLDKNRVVLTSDDGRDAFTSSTPVAMQHLLTHPNVKKGDLGVIINVASGLQVGTAIYRF